MVPSPKYPFWVRMYNELYDDLFKDSDKTALGVVERAGVLNAILPQIKLKKTKPEPLIRFTTRYEGKIVGVEFTYSVLYPNERYPIVVIMPTMKQISDSFTNDA